MKSSRLYSIEVKDAETGATVVLTVVDWTANQKLFAVAVIGQLTGTGHANGSELATESERGIAQYH